MLPCWCRVPARWVVYPQAMKVFREVEEEVLRLATHYCEQYAAQLHAGGRASEADEIDRCVRCVLGFVLRAKFATMRLIALGCKCVRCAVGTLATAGKRVSNRCVTLL